MSRWKSQGAPLFLGVALLAVSAPAAAWCRSTTCDPQNLVGDCTVDPSTGCVAGGMPLRWPSRCLSFSVQEGGSPKSGIDAATTRAVVGEAYATWLGASCNGEKPGFRVFDFGLVACNAQEYNQRGPNANVWLYRDTDWPHGALNGDMLGLTTVVYDTETGEIYDADVELNSAQAELTLGDSNVKDDLRSIITHEAGHFLGLAHSRAAGAVMFSEYQPGETSLRALSADDVDGICTLYPPDGTDQQCSAEAATPRRGFSTECSVELDEGCVTGRSPRGTSFDWLVLAAPVALALTLARRRARQHAVPARVRVRRR